MRSALRYQCANRLGAEGSAVVLHMIQILNLIDAHHTTDAYSVFRPHLDRIAVLLTAHNMWALFALT